jgi:Domain of unknown function (DUF3786)
MTTNYEKMIKANLSGLFEKLPPDLEVRLGASKSGKGFSLQAFGETAWFDHEQVTFSGKKDVDPRGLLVSLYAAHAGVANIQIEPLKAFKDFPGSMHYHGAFSANSERVLIPHVNKIQEKQGVIMSAFDGEAIKSGDFSMLLYPFPKIAVITIFYLEDEDFPPSATCLFSANALDFMPLDGLADVAEYTSGKIIRMVSE